MISKSPLFLCLLSVALFGCQPTEHGTNPADGTATAVTTFSVEDSPSGKVLVVTGSGKTDPITSAKDIEANMTRHGCVGVVLRNGRIDSKAVEEITSISTLKVLGLDATEINSGEVDCLVRCQSLADLRIPKSNLSDEDFKTLLASLPKLRQLVIGAEKLTSTCAETVAQLPELTSLILHGTAWDDAAYEKLADMPKLQSLYLIGGTISDAALSKLEANIPHVHVP